MKNSKFLVLMKSIIVLLCIVLLVDLIQLFKWQFEVLKPGSSAVDFVFIPFFGALFSIYSGVIFGIIFVLVSDKAKYAFVVIVIQIFQFIIVAIGNDGRTLAGFIFYRLMGMG